MAIIRIILFLLVAVTIDWCRGQFAISPKLNFYYGPTYLNVQIYDANAMFQLVQHPRFDPNRKTVMFIHGYFDSPLNPTVRSIVAAYLQRNDHNVIVVDWSRYSVGDYYLQALPNLVSVSTKLGEILFTIFQNGRLNINNFHLVGHSLGAQSAGYIGRYLISKSNNAMKIPRITGLDPAGPGFFSPTPFYQPLTAKSAMFVDIIHTDKNSYGQPYSTGTVDFWPNGGSSQPGCPTLTVVPFSPSDLCDHIKAVDFYAESVSSSDRYEFLASSRLTGQTVNMGLNCPTNARGDYYLRTNMVRPFSLGARGVGAFG